MQFKVKLMNEAWENGKEKQTNLFQAITLGNLNENLWTKL